MKTTTVHRIEARLKLIGLSKAVLARVMPLHPSCISRYWRYDEPPEWFMARVLHVLGWTREQLESDDLQCLLAPHPHVGRACPDEEVDLVELKAWLRRTYRGPRKP